MPDNKKEPWMKYLYFDQNGCLVIVDASLGEEISNRWGSPMTTDFCVRYDYKKKGNGGGNKSNGLCTCRKVAPQR